MWEDERRVWEDERRGGRVRLASFPGLPRLQFLTASDQKLEPGKAWERGWGQTMCPVDYASCSEDVNCCVSCFCRWVSGPVAS